MRCDACRKHEKRLTGLTNFSHAWITGSYNHKTSNITDHANSEQHRAAMIQVAKASKQPVTSYSPIARSITAMEATAMARMVKKFDICYVLAKESLAFRKYPALHALEERHGVDLGLRQEIHTLHCQISKAKLPSWVPIQLLQLYDGWLN